MVGGALGLGVAMGLALSLLLELLNRRVRGVEDLNLTSEIHCLGVIEQPRKRPRHFEGASPSHARRLRFQNRRGRRVTKLARVPENVTAVATSDPTPSRYDTSPALLTLSAPLSRGAEEIRALRTHVMTQHVQAGRRALAVCAPSIDVGCSFVAANLAVASGAGRHQDPAGVDADLRAPMIDKLIRPKQPSPGLSACLASPTGHVDDFIDNDVFPRLSVFYAGAPAANAHELLSREWFEDVMSHCLREYDMTIVDTPPANTSADVRRISNLAGYGMVVARKNKSMIGDVRTLVEQMLDDHVRVIGTLMNAD